VFVTDSENLGLIHRELHVLRAEQALESADLMHWLQKTLAEHAAEEFLWRGKFYRQDCAALPENP